MNTANQFNAAISASAVASWAVPEVAAARSKRYAASVQIGERVEMFKSVPAALRALGVESGWRSVRAAARDCQYVELEVDGQKAVITALEVI
jgi:hypothetical protein